MRLAFRLNGESVEVDADADALLLDVVRGLGLTGTKEGCAVGVCGACTMLVEDLPVSSCLYLAGCAEGADIWTIEGLARKEPGVVEAFVEHEGMQCGICTSGQVVAAAALAREASDCSEEEIRAYMAGNLCRCTGYVSIVDAVEAYLERRRADLQGSRNSE